MSSSLHIPPSTFNGESSSSTITAHERQSLDKNLSEFHPAHPQSNLLQVEEVENIRTRPSLQSSSPFAAGKTKGKINFNKRVKETLKRIEQMPDPAENLVTTNTNRMSPSGSRNSGIKNLVAETARKSLDMVRRTFSIDGAPNDYTTIAPRVSLEKLATASPTISATNADEPLTATVLLDSGETGIVDPKTGEVLATMKAQKDPDMPLKVTLVSDAEVITEAPVPVVDTEDTPMDRARKAARKRRQRRKQESQAKRILKQVWHHTKLTILSVVIIFFIGLWLWFEPRNAERIFVVSKATPLGIPLHQTQATYSISLHITYPKYPMLMNIDSNNNNNNTNNMDLVNLDPKIPSGSYLFFELEYTKEEWNLSTYSNLTHAFGGIHWNFGNHSQVIPFDTHNAPKFYEIEDYLQEEQVEKEWNWKLPIFTNTTLDHLHYRIKISTSLEYGVAMSLKLIQHPIAYNYKVLFALAILVGVYILIIFELVPRTLAAMIGSFVAVATLAALAEKHTLEDIVTWIDYGTLVLLFSMMVIVAVLSKTGIFEFFSFVIFRISGGRIWLLTIMFSIFTAFVSAFLDNVTTMLLVTPVTIEICKTMNISPVYLLITEVMMSNLGGTATPVGDPPVAIAANYDEIVALGYDFFTFVINLAPNVIICTFFGTIYLVILNVRIYSDDARKKRRAKQEAEVKKILIERARQMREEYYKNPDAYKDFNEEDFPEEEEEEEEEDNHKIDVEMNDYSKIHSNLPSTMNLLDAEQQQQMNTENQVYPTVVSSNSLASHNSPRNSVRMSHASSSRELSSQEQQQQQQQQQQPSSSTTLNVEPTSANSIVSNESTAMIPAPSKEGLVTFADTPQVMIPSQQEPLQQITKQDTKLGQPVKKKSPIVVINGIEVDGSKYRVKDWRLLVICTVVLVITILAFFAENFLKTYLHLHTSLSYTAIIGALIMLIMSGVEHLDHILEMVEWGTLVFFAGLFVMMHALEKLGLLEFIGQVIEVLILMVPEELRLFVALSVIIWVAAFTSGFVDNIPFIIAMIPIVLDMSGPPISLPFKPLLMTLLFGCCLGGNATIIGASCNIVAAGISEQNGYHISFVQFFKVGFPFMLFTVAISHIYVIIVYVLIGWN